MFRNNADKEYVVFCGLRFTPFLQKNETLVTNLFFNVCY